MSPKRAAKRSFKKPAESAPLRPRIEHRWRRAPYGKTIRRPRELHPMMFAAIGSGSMEVAALLGVDESFRLRFAKTIAFGNRHSVHVPAWTVFEPAFRFGLFAVILAHNHPRGRCTPSGPDILMTHHMATLGKELGIPVLDHWIITRRTLVSLAERGFMVGSLAPWAA